MLTPDLDRARRFLAAHPPPGEPPNREALGGWLVRRRLASLGR